MTDRLKILVLRQIHKHVLFVYRFTIWCLMLATR